MTGLHLSGFATRAAAVCVERLGCFEIAKWPEHMGGGWHRSAECRSCRSHDRAKRTKTVCRNAWPRCLASNTAVTFHGFRAG